MEKTRQQLAADLLAAIEKFKEQLRMMGFQV